jgi:hypothetical protein
VLDTETVPADLAHVKSASPPRPSPDAPVRNVAVVAMAGAVPAVSVPDLLALAGGDHLVLPSWLAPQRGGPRRCAFLPVDV